MYRVDLYGYFLEGLLLMLFEQDDILLGLSILCYFDTFLYYAHILVVTE